MPANKKVRRVRVIEVIDDDEVLDDDLEEVLEALDESDNDTSDESDEAAAPAKQATAKQATAKQVVTKPTTVKQATVKQATVKPATAKRLLGSPRTTAVLVIVLVAALASLAIWQWRQAARLAAERAERRAVAEVAGEYGDTAFSYTASTYRTSIDRNLKLLGGDLLATYKRDTIPNLPTVFNKNPQLVMESKIKKVYVGDVNGTLATAVILVDITLRTPQGVNDGSNALLRLSLAKNEGGWKITQQAASGQGDDAASQLPTLPNASATPSDTPSPKPKK
ncbi:MAG TPA: hypothetical protein VFU43_12690 [Streptosporangiaceae bacterium]|nr:hypothetical protein [Streptosporangiaceae bacterium]